MIEVEKKFILKPGDEERLLAGATFMKNVRNEDTLFDTADYSFTKKDWWLRERNGEMEIKIPTQAMDAQAKLDQYEEINDPDELRRRLELPAADGPLTRAELEQHGIVPFHTIITDRREYRLESFTIDLDRVDTGYEVAEIELLVEPVKQDEAVKKIVEFATSRGLEMRLVYGKIVEWARRKRPDLFDMWMKAWGTDNK